MADAERSAGGDAPRRVGRFEMFSEVASGGFASIHLGRTVGMPGFAKTVAIKRLHRQYARHPDTRRMFLDEARVVARVQHPNVVPTLDLIEEDDELFLVMEFVLGVSLAHLLKLAEERGERIPIGIALRVMTGALEGLHAAHEAVDEHGERLCVIHRDVTPDNILVGADGHPRLIDFGVARAMGQHYETRKGEVKGKLAFLSPEQVNGVPIDHRTDVFSASAVLWECLTGRRLFVGRHFGELIQKIARAPIEPPSSLVPALPPMLDSIVMRGLERDRDERWPTALKMAEALDALGGLVSSRETGRWVNEVAAERLAERAAMRAAVERAPRHHESTVDDLAERGAPEARSDKSGTRIVDGADIDDEDSDLPDDAVEGQLPRGESDHGSEAGEGSGERVARDLALAAKLGQEVAGGGTAGGGAALTAEEPAVSAPAAARRRRRARWVVLVVVLLAAAGVLVWLVVGGRLGRDGPAQAQPPPTATPLSTAGASTAAPPPTAAPTESAAPTSTHTASSPTPRPRPPVRLPRRPPAGPKPTGQPSEFTPGGI